MNEALVLNCIVGALAYWAWMHDRQLPLLCFVWTYPFIGGNWIGSVDVYYTPREAFGFAMVFFGMLDATRNAVVSQQRLLFALFAVVAIMSSVTGLLAISINEVFLSSWRQPAPERVVRSLFYLLMFWATPAAMYSAIRTQLQVIRLFQAIHWSCMVYCTLALFQFALETFVGIDPFPIRRFDAVSAETLTQSLIGADGSGRLTGVCGEPRYLSSFCIVWLIVHWVGGMFGLLPTRRVYIGIILCASVAFLSGSRTGILTLAIVLTLIIVAATIQGRYRFALQCALVAALLSVLVGSVVALEIGSFGKRLGSEALSEELSVELGPIRIPIEWADYAAAGVIREKWVSWLIGFGPGLWQYYVDPWSFQLHWIYFGDSRGVGLDSMRPNVSLLFLFSNVGLLGIILVLVMFSQAIGGLARVCSSKASVKPAVLGMGALIFFAGGAEWLCQAVWWALVVGLSVGQLSIRRIPDTRRSGYDGRRPLFSSDKAAVEGSLP
jgi:hypothetical protein